MSPSARFAHCTGSQALSNKPGSFRSAPSSISSTSAAISQPSSATPSPATSSASASNAVVPLRSATEVGVTLPAMSEPSRSASTNESVPSPSPSRSPSTFSSMVKRIKSSRSPRIRHESKLEPGPATLIGVSGAVASTKQMLVEPTSWAAGVTK